MAIRKIDLENKIERAKIKPVLTGTHASDPSPFSRAVKAAPSREQIEIAAYYRAEARGFAPGHETEDWLAAERELSGDSATAVNH